MRTMKKILLLIVFATSALATWAIQVNNTAGSLAEKITDLEISNLTITGTMDARDFKFIADSLDRLTEIDLSQVTILPYSSTEKSSFELAQTFESNSIPFNSFFGKPLASVVLPTQLKSIGFAAFAGCDQLHSIDLPATVDSIASFAFNGSGLTSINLPAGVHALGEGVFSRCTSLTSANLPNANVNNFTFLGDTLLSDVTLGEGVKSIGIAAFNGCTALKNIKFAANSIIVNIDHEAFIKSGISTLDLTTLSRLTAVGDWALATSAVKEVKLPSSVTAIGEGAFYYASQLQEVNLPGSINEVSDYTFAGSNAIVNDSILNEGITSVGDYAFYNWNQSRSFLIPSTVNYLGSKAMAGMTGLKAIKALPTSIPALGDSVWAGVNQPLVNLDIPQASIGEEYGKADQWKEFHLLKDYLMGDVNDDGLVDVGDVTALINRILGNNPTPFNEINGDINEDGIYDVSDVTGIINIILNGETRILRKVRGYQNSEETGDALYFDEITIKPGETRTIELKLNNEQEYIATQFEVTMPQGLVIVEEQVKAAQRAGSHTFASRIQRDGMTTRFVGFSMSNEAFTGSEGAILTLTVKADEQLAAQAAINIDNVCFITTESKRVLGASTISLVNNATGVENIVPNSTKVYTHGSTLVIKTDKPTTAQLVSMNGMVTELYVEAGHNEYEGFNTGFYVVRIDGRSHKVSIR